MTAVMTRPESLLQDDLFVGLRFGFNDAESSSILGGTIIDLDDQSTSFRIEASRRVFDDTNPEPRNSGFFPTPTPITSATVYETVISFWGHGRFSFELVAILRGL